jgi:hypothetical protein
MEIQALKLFVTEQDLNDLIGRHLPDDQPLENVKIRIAPEGVSVTGEYPLFVRVAFETLWELTARGGTVTARLSDLKAMGLPAVLFKGMVLKAIEEAVATEPWLAFDDDTIEVDIDGLLAAQGVPAKTNLNSIRCLSGAVILEAANP